MVPKGWKSALVSDICTLQNGRGFKPEEWDTKGLPIIRIQNLNGNPVFNYFSGTVDEKWLVQPGQMLFAWAGTKGVSFGPTIWRGEVGVLNQHIFKVFNREGVDNNWLYLALRHITDRIEDKAHGFKSTLVHVKKSEIDKHPILLPPYSEQKHIAEILSTWDRAIESVERLVSISHLQKRALMRELFSGAVRMRGYKQKWSMKPLHEIAMRVEARNEGGNQPILTISSTAGFVRQDEKYNRYMAGKSVENYILLRKGEFAYNKGNSKTYQFGCVFPLEEFDVALVPHVYVCFRLNEGSSHKYFKYLFESDYLRAQLGRLVNTGVRNNGLLNITPDKFLGTKVPVPPLAEQQAIADIVDTAATEHARLIQNLDALRREKRGLMQQLLTGKRRVLVPQFKDGQDGQPYDVRQKVREDFYEALTAFGMCVKTALSSQSFFEDGSFSESKIKQYKDDLRFFTRLRLIAKQDAQETVDFSAYEDQIRKLVDRHVVGEEVQDSEGVYLVNSLGVDADPAKWSEEKTRNETDIIRSRIKKTIEQELADDPFAQVYFSELLRQAIDEAASLFDHPFKQYALFKSFDDKIAKHEVAGIPEAVSGSKHARAYFGILKLVIEPKDEGSVSQDALTGAAQLIERVVRAAVSENSLNPQNIEAAIRQALLPKLFELLGLEKAKDVIERVISVTRVGLARGDF